MKPKGLFSFLVLVTIVLSLLVACAKPASEPTPAPAPEPAPASPGVIELIYNDPTNAQAPKSQHIVAWGNKIEELSGGRVKFTYYWSNSLIPQEEIPKGVASGVADVSYFLFPIDFFPLNYNIMYLPFMGYQSMEMGTEVWQQLYSQFPELQEEIGKAGIQLLCANLMPPMQIHTAKKAVKTPKDMAGMKLIASGQMAEIVNLAGGAPVDLGNIMEMYTSLERGLVEGVINHFPVVHVFGCTPLVPYHTILGEGGISMGLHGLIINPDTFNSLPDDVQKIIQDLNPWFVKELLKQDNAEIARAMNDGKEMGHTFIYLTPEEIQVWEELALPLHEEWLTEMEEKGKPARAIYEEAKRLIAEYGK